MRPLLLGLTAFAGAAPSVAQEASPADSRWLLVGTHNEARLVEVDRQSLRRDGDKVTVWTRRTWHHDGGFLRREEEIDCRKRSVVVFVAIFDSTKGGYKRNEFGLLDREPSSIEPESTDELVFNAVCR